MVFIESGILFPILPGDSLLFTAGLIAAAGAASNDVEVKPFASLWVLLVTVPIAAFLGSQVGYYIGHFSGTTLFKPENKFLKKKYVDDAAVFFDKYGPRTILLARFVPIVRTLVPLVAGAAKMKTRTFLVYNTIGAILWGAGLVWLGYLLGNITFIREHIDIIFVGIVLVSVLPIIFEATKRYRNRPTNS